MKRNHWTMPMGSMLGSHLARLSRIWQMQPVRPSGLHKLARKYRLQSDEDDIIRLWRLGLLRADYVVSDSALNIPGITYRDNDSLNRLVFTDDRQVSEETELIDSFRSLPPKVNVDLFFHPFRL